MESSESSKVMELERARALLAEQNAALELATVEAEIADVKANLAMESLRIGTAEFVNRFDFAPVGYGFQKAGPFGGMFSLSSSTDRVHGRDYPWLVSEADIRNSVGLARLVTKSHCPGVAIERNLKAHVIGKGGNYTAGVRKGAKVPDGLLEAIQDLVDEFVDENKILGEGEHEWYWRGVRDGETIVGLYPMPKGRHGIVDAREIEPLQVCTPGMAPLSDEEIVKRCGHDITCATNWEFGVHKADHDAQQIFGYAIEYDGDWDYLPARYVGHWKRNVDRNVCRGVTDFYQAWQWISEQSRLLGNTTAGAAERSAIAYIVQHIQGVTQAKVRSMRSDKADATYTYTGPSGATKQFHRENIPPGSKLDIPKGQEYVAIANGTDPSSAYISVLQAISRQVGIVWNMPEGMISGDDSGASVTASVVAGSRFDKFATMEQGAFGSFMLGILWKVIKFAYDRGRLERFGFSRDKDGSFYQLKKKIELIVKYPDVSNKHPIETEQLRQIRKQNGVLSVKTWTDEVGLDYETERKNMEEEQGGQGGGQPGMPGADGGMPPPDQGAGGPPGMPPGGPGGMPDQGGMPGMPPGGMPPMPPDQGGGGFGGPPPAPAPGPNPFQQATGYDPYIESPQPGEPVGGQTAYAQPSGGVTFRNAPGFGSQEQFARSLATVVESAVEKAVGKLAEELKAGGASESFFGHRGRPGAVGGSSPRAEPWQLTQAQYSEQHPKVVAANKAIAEAMENLSSVIRHSDNRGDWFSAGAKASAQLENAKAEADAEHEQHVLSRLMKGQDVPPHVLADYPHANQKVVLSGGNPDMLAKLGSLGVAEAHAPAGFNHTSPLVIDGDQYTGARCCVQGLDINIENRAGTQRSGVSDNGEPWCVTMRNDYGEIVAIDGQAAHDGRDFDPVDVFLGPCCDSELVFVVDQYRDDGAFDEHKCMVGWTNAADAARAYSSNYDDDRECGPITPMTMDEFKDWLRNPARLHSPASPNAHVVRDRVDDSPELSDDVLCLLDIADKFGLTDEEVDALSLLAEKKHVAEAHAPKGFNKTSPLIIDGKSYVGGQFIPGKSQGEVDRAANKITESIADQYGLTASERLAFEHATSWMPYHGPRGGHGWQSMQTGRVLYQIERPGDSQHEGPSADEPSSEAILAQQAEQAERERAARLERESREREIARRGQAKQSAMSQREMELQSERQRPEQAKRAAIAERERAEREREEEKPKPVKPYPKGKVSPFTAEVIDDARHIPFVDDVQQIASDDYDGIEAAMTPAEKREMNESLDTKKQEYIDEQMDGYEPYVDRREVAKDAGYDDEDVSGWFESQIDSMADDLSQDVYDRLKEHITEWYQKTSRVGTEAIDNAQDYLQRKLGDDYPDELDDLIDRYRNEAESEIDDAISEAESEVEDDKRQEVEGEYDDDEAREEYLDQFYQDNDDRFAHQSDEMEWGYDSDGDHVLRFTTEDGIRYSILAQKVKPIELLKGSYDISFHDRTRGYGITGKAGAKTAMEVFRKVSAAVVSLVSKRNPTALTFTAAEPSRQRLYDKLVQHVAAASPDYAAVAAKKLGGVKGYLVCRREVLGKLRAQYESGNIASMLAAGGELQTLVEQSIGEIAMPKPTKEFSLSPDVELEEINVDPESLTEEDLLDTLAEIESMERDENNNQDHTE